LADLGGPDFVGLLAGGFHHGDAAVMGGVEGGDRVDDECQFHGTVGVRAEVDFPMGGFDRGWVRGCSLVFSEHQMHEPAYFCLHPAAVESGWE
jgi:hypothetical protein